MEDDDGFYCKGRTGEIREVHRRGSRELSLDWKIPGFLNLKGRLVLGYYKSPRISFSDECWHFRVYPNYLEGIQLSLCRDDAGTAAKTINIAVGVNGSGGVEERSEEEYEFRNKEESNWMTLCTRPQLSEQKERLVPDGVLTIRCEMKVPGAARGIQRAVEDFGRLLATGDRSDITVQVGDVKIPTHSFVLFARCPALSAPLRHESLERASGRIVVEGCEPDVFRDLLHFLYTGSVPSLTKHNAFALYRMADRYLVDDLKCLCLEHVQDTMSVDTFCDAVRLAVTHDENGLMERAVAFATDNIQSILRSEEWRTFIRECPDEANDILIKSVVPPRKRQKSKH